MYSITRKTTGNDYNEMIIKNALENMFNEKYAYLDPFISRINVVID